MELYNHPANQFVAGFIGSPQINFFDVEMVLCIRGEDIKLDPQSVELYKQQAVLTDTEVMGNENNLYFTFRNRMAAARVSKDEIGQIDDTITFVLLPSKMHFFDKNTGKSYTEKTKQDEQTMITQKIHPKAPDNWTDKKVLIPPLSDSPAGILQIPGTRKSGGGKIPGSFWTTAWISMPPRLLWTRREEES